MNSEIERYIPALSFEWLTPLYDPLARWGLREEGFRRRLVERASLQPGMRLLDVGTGTGTQLLRIQQAHPRVLLVGLDGDLTVLTIARAKAARAGVSIPWHQALAGALPYGAATFDRALMSLMLHHLTPTNKQYALREAWRVLRPGGQLLIVDFGPPHNFVSRVQALVVRHLEETALHLAGGLPALMGNGGFAAVEQLDQWTTVVGPLALWRAVRPAPMEDARLDA